MILAVICGVLGLAVSAYALYAIRGRELGWWLSAYLTIQCAFSLAGIGMALVGSNAALYTWIYLAFLGGVALPAMVWALRTLKLDALSILTLCLGFAWGVLALSFMVWMAVPARDNNTYVMLAEGGWYAFAGGLALCGMKYREGHFRKVCMVMGLFFLSRAAWAYLFAYFVKVDAPRWESLSAWIPAVLYLAGVGYLALISNGIVGKIQGLFRRRAYQKTAEHVVREFRP